VIVSFSKVTRLMLVFQPLNVQGERVSLLRREKEVTLKAEAGDAARKAGTISDARAADLELKLQQCMSDCDTLQLKVEDATQASGVVSESLYSLTVFFFPPKGTLGNLWPHGVTLIMEAL
jgi:hypothetical protein